MFCLSLISILPLHCVATAPAPVFIFSSCYGNFLFPPSSPQPGPQTCLLYGPQGHVIPSSLMALIQLWTKPSHSPWLVDFPRGAPGSPPGLSSLPPPPLTPGHALGTAQAHCSKILLGVCCPSDSLVSKQVSLLMPPWLRSLSFQLPLPPGEDWKIVITIIMALFY